MRALPACRCAVCYRYKTKAIQEVWLFATISRSILNIEVLCYRRALSCFLSTPKGEVISANMQVLRFVVLFPWALG